MPKMPNQILTIDASSRRADTKTGFLYATAIAASIGVQEYLPDEIGVEPVEGRSLVRIARLEEEVFSKDSLSSWVGADMTNEHPDGTGFVTVDNQKKLSVGHITGPATRSGNNLLVPLVIKDSSTITDIENGKSRVSAGYLATYERKDGNLNGQPYDYVQRKIKVNHLSVVNKGRADAALILDSKEKIMTKELEAKVKALEIENTALKEKNEELGKRPTFDSLSKIVQLTKDAELINKDGSYENKDPEAIKREALGVTVTKDHSADVVDFAFESALANAKLDEVEEEFTPTLFLDSGEEKGKKESPHSKYIKSLNIQR